MDRTSLAARTRKLAGEFAVIVVGVLVALTADRWQQSRIDRQTEHSYLERLRNELADDTTRMTQLVERSLQKRRALAYLEMAIAQRPPPDSARQISREVMLASASLEQDFRTATFDELLSTGRLILLRDADVREAVMAYRENIERYLPRIERRRSEYVPLLMTYIPPSARVSVTTDSMDAQRVPMWAYRFLSDPRLPLAVNAEYRFAEYAGERYQRFHDEGARVLRMVASSLDRQR